MTASTSPLRCSRAPNPRLKTGIYGDGQSYDEKEPHQWRLLCFDKTMGNLLWDKLGYEAVPRQQRHTKASHCNSDTGHRRPARGSHFRVRRFVLL